MPWVEVPHLRLNVLAGRLAEVEQQAHKVAAVIAESSLHLLDGSALGDGIEAVLDCVSGGLSQLLGGFLVLTIGEEQVISAVETMEAGTASRSEGTL